VGGLAPQLICFVVQVCCHRALGRFPSFSVAVHLSGVFLDLLLPYEGSDEANVGVVEDS
jgi:hypothetical protein